MSKFSVRSIVLTAVVAFPTLLACGGTGGSSVYCEKLKSCAAKSGDAFSMTSCEAQERADFERADSLKCGPQYNDVTACIATLSCSARYEDLVTECGGSLKTLGRCMDN